MTEHTTRIVHQLRHLAAERRRLEDDIRSLVDEARTLPTTESHGFDDTTPLLTWAQIADALGVTHQAVQQRYGTIARGLDREPHGGTMDPLPLAAPKATRSAAEGRQRKARGRRG